MSFDARVRQDVPAHSISASETSGNEATHSPTALEFFAGSGLVSFALKRFFSVVWANDFCQKKAAVYRANHKQNNLAQDSIENIRGVDLPPAVLSWASFPCQDLSLAGLIGGIGAKRSGLVWEWLRVIDEMKRPPSILVAENVVGLVSADGGVHYKNLHAALVARNYRVGAILLDAINWIPQSRPRIFVIAVSREIEIPPALLGAERNWLHSDAIVRAAEGLQDWLWWHLPKPMPRKLNLADIVERDAPVDGPEATRRNLSMIPKKHRDYIAASNLDVFPGYKRTRKTGQMLELRFDGVAGCLRTPEGGSSRQVLVIRHGTDLKTRLLTARETARLMGAPDSYKLPGSYNDGYRAMGDAVAVPVAKWLAQYLLAPLAATKDLHEKAKA